MADDKKQEILYSALVKLQDQFEADMKWSPEATSYEKTLVKCNLNGFVSFLSRAMPENADSSESQVCREILEIMEEYDRQSAKGYVDSPGGIEHKGDAFKLLARWREILMATK